MIVILNGPPRSGKSSIAAAMQESLDGIWINFGVDSFGAMTPQRLQPGVGLRPGGERPDLEPGVEALYRGLFAAVAALADSGLNVVVDVGMHEDYARPLPVRAMAAAALRDRQVLFVGVDCALEVARQRRRETWGGQGFAPSATGDDPVRRWHHAVHHPGDYDLQLDTGGLPPEQCAALIGTRLRDGLTPSALFGDTADDAATGAAH